MSCDLIFKKCPTSLSSILMKLGMLNLTLLLLLKKVGNARLGKRLTPSQSEDPNPTTPTHRMKEEKGKTAGDKKSERAARPIKRHWPCS